MPEPTDSVRVVAICGSLHAESYTRAGLVAALQGAQELGIDARLIDLNDYNLPLLDASKENSDLPAGVLRLRRDMRQAQGILLGTPEYHAGYSGVLKNALDYMGFSEFEGKTRSADTVSSQPSLRWVPLTTVDENSGARSETGPSS